jgi:error-prone DNA polymerase
LCVTSNFTFLTGASHPEELVEQAAHLGHRAVAVTDRNSLAGVVRAHLAAKRLGFRCLVGTMLELADPAGLSILAYPSDRASYGRLCRLLTLGKRRTTKGSCRLCLHDLLEHQEGLLAVVMPPRVLDGAFVEVLEGLRDRFDDDRLSLAASHRHRGDDRQRLGQLEDLANHAGVPLVAVNEVRYHVPARRPLHDALVCIREGCTLADAGYRLDPNAERHLKPAAEMARLFAGLPRAMARTVEIAERAGAFTLDQLEYEYPHEVCPPDRAPIGWLADLAWRGAGDRYPAGVPDAVRRRLDHELQLIDELRYAPYFLTVHDLVVFARSQGILCQGRGAAANSAVCYCLGVTAVDPERIDLLFERFVSRERDEPPDIDIDFEHERREEVIQYIYGKYGRDRAALTAEVISYRGRSAVREVGKVLGLSLDAVDRLARNMDWWQDDVKDLGRLREMGFDPDDPTMRRFVHLVGEIRGFPRHLSQHVGGFVITRGPLCELVPIENAAMEDRTVIEWDKDDIDAMGMMKVDVLGLGMLTCIRKGLEFINGATKRPSDQATEGGAEGEPGERWRRDASSDVSRSDCVATGDAVGAAGIRIHGLDAERRAVRIAEADSESRRIDSLEYCRGSWAAEQAGLPEVPADSTGLVGGVDHAVSVGSRSRSHEAERGCEQPARGGGENPARADHGPGAQGSREKDRIDNPRSLGRLVAWSLPLELHTIPPEDPSVYDMICRADTIGVFQIESRAQMSMLPRLRPRCFYDLVIEVAIVRPGPIQGDMVHPYLRRRRGEEAIEYPSDAVKRVLGKTLGVPLFQEQAMALSIVAAGFTAGEADELRRAMAAWKRKGNEIEVFGQRLIEGMTARGYERSFADRCFRQIKGFSEYGFPESHAASFALLVYVSAWMKKHEPAAFAAALINSQPMGFYAPAQIVQDARSHGVEVRCVDVNHSGWDCSLEESDQATERPSDQGEEEGSRTPRDPSVAWSLGRLVASPALRLGLRLIKGLREDDARAIEGAVRESGPFDSIEALRRHAGLKVAVLRRLAGADAFGSMGLDRQAALWQVRAMRDEVLPMFEGVAPRPEPPPRGLPPVPAMRRVMQDYASIRLSLKAHPMSFLRPELDDRGVMTARRVQDIEGCPDETVASVAGIAIVRQRPSTAAGIVFMTLEDETGIANLVVRPDVYERHRAAARHGIIILARGTVEREGEVVHVVATSLESLDDRLAELEARSRDFR